MNRQILLVLFGALVAVYCCIAVKLATLRQQGGVTYEQNADAVVGIPLLKDGRRTAWSAELARTNGAQITTVPRLKRVQKSPTAVALLSTKQPGAPSLTWIPPYLRNNESLPDELTNITQLYSHPRGDRSGAAMMDALTSHAYAYYYGIPFVGICGFLGVSDNRVVRPVPQTHQDVIEMWGLKDVLRCNVCPQNETETFVDARKAGLRGFNTGLFTEEWRQAIQSQRNESLGKTVLTSQATTASHPLQVAIHIRRGDISPCTNGNRYLSNQFFLDLLEQTVLAGAGANVTIFSEEESFESLDVFKEKYTVAIGGDLRDVWTAMDQSDMLVMSPSTFSLIPALLSPRIKRVVYAPFEWQALKEWKVANQTLLEQAKSYVKRMKKEGCDGKKPKKLYTSKTES